MVRGRTIKRQESLMPDRSELNMISRSATRRLSLAAGLLSSSPTIHVTSFFMVRFKRYQAYEDQFDQEALHEARSWYQKFDASKLPSGNTTYSRSSGPGGQHVNKTETKATTAFALKELLSTLPKFLHTGVRSSKYYSASNDCLIFHAQNHRSRTANAEANRTKLLEELTRLYQATTPSKTSIEKRKKHEQIQKRFHASRLKQKKLLSSKKQSRRTFSE